MKPIKIGLTGGISSGKSTVASYIESKGYYLIDADKVARSLMNIGESNYLLIVENFSEDILLENKNIDRKKLGQIIFNDEEKRLLLNRLSHENIYKEINSLIENSKEDIIFVDIPLLFEAKFEEDLYIDFDEIWLVSIDREIQIERLIKRDNISREYAIKKIDSQMKLEKKEEISDRTILNNGSKDELYEYLDENMEKWIREIEEEKKEKKE